MRAHRGKSTTAHRITDRSEHSKDPNGHYAGRGVDILPPTDVECLHPIMRTEEPYKNRIELLQGTLDMLILQTLQWRPRHGYAIAQGIRSGSDEVLQVETGSLYPALHRLEKRGWLRATWGTTENRQRARFYGLTAKGKKQLAAEHAKWSQMVEAVAALMSREQRGQQA
jgi:PadR family transcriptional regulator, regulatory protein PadR